MRTKFFPVVFILFLIFPVIAFAQSAKIIDLKGEVTVKLAKKPDWRKAKVNMLLNKDDELQTQAGAYCTLAFDEELKNIVSVKEKSLIKIEDLHPGAIFLPEGRVFTIIQQLGKHEKFQVRTPTAIAGARGTGWSTGFLNGLTQAQCFNQAIFVLGLDASGNQTGETNVPAGFGITVDQAGLLSGLFELSDADFASWQDFISHIQELMGFFLDDYDEEDAFYDSKQESRNDFSSEFSRENREQREGASSSGGDSGGGGNDYYKDRITHGY